MKSTDLQAYSSKAMLDRTSSELKSALRFFISMSKGQSDELDLILESMYFQLESDYTAFTFSNLIELFQKKMDVVLSENSENEKQRRMNLARTLNSAHAKEISTHHVDLINGLLSSTKSVDITNEVLLEQFAETILFLSDDIAFSRSDSSTIVGDDHGHMKQNKANVIASDIQKASRRLVRELLHLSTKLRKSFPCDEVLQVIEDKAEEIKDKNNQFFKSLDLLQELNSHVAHLINKERLGTQEMLLGIQSRIFNVFNSSSILQESIIRSEDNANSMDLDAGARLRYLREKASSSDSIEEIQEVVNDSIGSLEDIMKSLKRRQNEIKKESLIRVKELTKELQDAKRTIAKVQDSLENKVEESLIDPLSKVGNRKGYSENIRQSYNLWQSGKQKLSIIVLDIDFFKRINDSHGHSIGDQVIRKVGSIIKEHAREGDYIARYGGEEFVIICNDTSLTKASKLAEKLRSLIHRKSFILRNSSEKIRISASFGVAEFTKRRCDLKAVFNAADKAMYKAKSEGRNKAVAAHNDKFITITQDKKNV